MLHRALIIALPLLLLLAACGDAGDTGDAARPGDADEVIPVEPDGGIGDGADPLPEQEPVDGTLTGTLGGDAQLEGGCAWLEAEDGTRYEVVYPTNWTVGTDPVQLVDPDGEVVAEEGDEVTVVGAVQNDMMSFCQIGPIFVATAVED